VYYAPSFLKPMRNPTASAPAPPGVQNMISSAQSNHQVLYSFALSAPLSDASFSPKFPILSYLLSLFLIHFPSFLTFVIAEHTIHLTCLLSVILSKYKTYEDRDLCFVHHCISKYIVHILHSKHPMDSC
jgi:hypothetical protein